MTVTTPQDTEPTPGTDQTWRQFLLAGGGLAGVATAVLGLVVIVGWYTGNRTLIQVLPQFVPMQYNTALGFVFSGLALTMLVAGRPRTAIALGAVTATIGGLTLGRGEHDVPVRGDDGRIKTAKLVHRGIDHLLDGARLAFVVRALLLEAGNNDDG